jgi:photosystem II stability/assembly factor-like uncharacterized protein
LHSIFFLSRDTGYIAAKYGGFYKTTNGGNNWTTILSPFINFNFEGLYCVNNNIVFASGIAPNWNKIIRTTNGGITLDSLKIDSINTVYSIFFTDASTGFIVSSRHNSQPSEGVIYKTTNAGSNWTLKFEDSNSIYSSTFYCVRFLNRNTGFVVGGSSFCKTTNAGETWKICRGYPIGDLYSVYFINENTGIACGYLRIIRTTTGGEPIGIKPISEQIPNSFSLSQNYPNPFNPATKIILEIPLSRGVPEGRGVFSKLIIYNVLGIEIATLINEHLLPGTYEVVWNAADFPSGVYFYQLQAGDYKETRRMILMK